MGNSQTLSCTSGEKSTKAQRKEEKYTPVDKTNGNAAKDSDETVVASSNVQENGVDKSEETTTKPEPGNIMSGFMSGTKV